MSAVEEIQAAIDNLTELRDGGFPGIWSAFHSGVANGDHSFVTDGEGEIILSVTANDGLDEELRAPTADLIVTLHRTIDAQLDWLRDQASRMRAELNTIGSPEVHYGHALALARAINGGTN